MRTMETWLHDGDEHVAVRWFVPDGEPRDAGVVIVPSIAHEDRAAATGLVDLADALASRGLVVASIDLAGTANAPGSLDDPGLVDRWARDVNAAVGSLRERGIEEVTVVGLRLGALVAAAALRHHPVDHFVAWSPVVSGRRFVRELKLMQNAATEVVGSANAGPGVTVAGFTLPPTLLSEIAALDASKIDHKPAPIVTLVDTAERLDAVDGDGLFAGAEVRRLVAPQTEPWLYSGSDLFTGPFEDIDAVADRVAPSQPASARRSAAGTVDEWTTAPGTASREFRHEGRLVRETWISFPVSGHAGARLSGIITEPADADAGPIGYVGITTVGPGRLFVDFARREAAKGHATLRFDPAGLGTSTWRRGRPRADYYYDSSGGADLAAAIDELRAHRVERVAIVGFCAGGLPAVEVASRDDVVAIVAINYDLAVRGSLRSRRRWPGLSRGHAALAELAANPHFSRVARALERNPVPSRGLRHLRRHLDRGTTVMLVFEPRDVSHDQFGHRARQAHIRRAATAPIVRVYDGLGHLPCGPRRDDMFDDIHDAVGGAR